MAAGPEVRVPGMPIGSDRIDKRAVATGLPTDPARAAAAVSSPTMTGENMMPATARAYSLARLFKRAAGVIAAIVGLIALIVGITFTASQTWPAATGTVESCTTSVSRTASGSTTHKKMCVVKWMDGEQPHTATVDLGNVARFAGESVDLRVHGDTAVVLTPGWVGYVAVVVGLLLLAGGGYFALRKSRPAASE